MNRIGYDKFEQRTYLKYCNGAETFYTYEPARRRLQNLTVNAGGKSIMDNGYTYDAVSNVLSVANKAALPESGKAGGQMAHAYTYDALYRLASATGTYAGADSKTASYRLEMGYDNMHRIVSKKQHLTQQGVQFDGTLHVGYDLAYTYGKTEGRKFQLAEVKDANYRTEENPDSVAKVDNNHTYTYDANGNLVYVNTGRIKQDGTLDSTAAERKLRWDEENRLTASDDNGFVTNYWYDADGERTVKTSGEGEQLYVNSEFAGGRTNTAKFSLYVSPYLVANQGGRYTKHIYIGSQRIVSKIGDFASYGSDPRRIQYAGSETDGLSVNYKQKYSTQQQVIKDNYAIFEVPYNGTDNNDYVDGQGFCCDEGSPEAAQARALAVENNFQDPDAYEKLQFYYHPDHLGSSSYITNLDGEVVQHIEYVPFGEVFIEERNSIWNTPYLFNAKEFDEETGLYYYGARYYDPRLSLWISVDPLSRIALNYTGYRFCFNSPTCFIDMKGLFETRAQAKEYREANGIHGRIQANSDGTYSINDYVNNISYCQGDDSGNMLGDKHSHDGVVESILITNKKNRLNYDDLQDFGDVGLSVFTEYGYDKIPTSKKSKAVYEVSRFIKHTTGIKIKNNSNIYRRIIPNGLKFVGNASGILSLSTIGYDIVNNKVLKSSNALDATMVSVSFVPGWGWIAGGVYFGIDIISKVSTGKSVGEHLDAALEEYYDLNDGVLLKW